MLLREGDLLLFPQRDAHVLSSALGVVTTELGELRKAATWFLRALDAFTRSSLQDEVSRIAREQNLTMVMVTHDIEEAVAMADRVLIMSANPGRIVGEMKVDLPFPRQRATPAYSRARENLMTTFEALVGGEGAAAATEDEESEPAGDREAA
jgi:NitT/TauT family transport system ATP-binding protein